MQLNKGAKSVIEIGPNYGDIYGLKVEGWKQERGCQVEYGPVGSNLGLPKARLFALSIGRNLRKPYLSPSDCRNRIPPGAHWGDMKCHG